MVVAWQWNGRGAQIALPWRYRGATVALSWFRCFDQYPSLLRQAYEFNYAMQDDHEKYQIVIKNPNQVSNSLI